MCQYYQDRIDQAVMDAGKAIERQAWKEAEQYYADAMKWTKYLMTCSDEE